MYIIGFFLACWILCLSSAQAAIEIYSAGKFFDSFEDYQESERKNLLPSISLFNAISNSEPLEILSPEEEQKINQISYDDKVNQEVLKIHDKWPKPLFRQVSSRKDIENVIRESIQNHPEPTLLIFKSPQMRILSSHSAKQDQNGVDGGMIDKKDKK